MRRREFIAGLASAAACPFAAYAEAVSAPVLGLLNGVPFEGPYAVAVEAIRRGLEETGYVEGRNLRIEYRGADGRYARLPELAADLIRSNVSAIVAIGGSTPELAAKIAPAAIPIVFAMAPDAVEIGLLNRETAQSNLTPTTASMGVASRRLELLFEIRRGANLVAYLDNSRLSSAFERNLENLTSVARARNRELLVFDAGTEQDVETAFTRIALQRVRGLVVGPDPFLISRQEQIIALAAESGVPTIYASRGAAVSGGLMSYGVVTDDMYRLAGIYAGRILQGATPAEFPVVLPTRFELVINSRTAQALRITLPRQLLVRADEIIY
jgi:putative ABC transport system substrate-binding protein